MLNNKATVIIMAMIVIVHIILPSPPPVPRSEQDYRDMLSGIFRRYDWRMKACPPFGADKGVGLLESCEGFRYVVQLKVSSEGRSDPLVPLLAQAILQAKSVAQAFPEQAVPLAVVAAPMISPSVAKKLRSFLTESAPDAAAGMFSQKAPQLLIPALRGSGTGTTERARSEPNPSPTPSSADGRVPVFGSQPVDAEGTARPSIAR